MNHITWNILASSFSTYKYCLLRVFFWPPKVQRHPGWCLPLLITFHIKIITIKIYIQKEKDYKTNVKNKQTTNQICDHKFVCRMMWTLSLCKTNFYLFKVYVRSMRGFLTIWDNLTWNKPPVYLTRLLLLLCSYC